MAEWTDAESLFSNVKMSLKFAPNLSMMFKEHPRLPERYLEAAKKGFTAVECQSPYEIPIEELVRAKHEAGVGQVLINSYQGKNHGEIGFACHPTHQNEFKSSLELSIRYAKALNCKKIHILAGEPQAGCTISETETTYINNLCYAAQLFQKEGLMGVIEPLCKQVRNNYFLQSYEKAVEYVRIVNSKHIRVLLDVFHLQMIHGNLTAQISLLAKYVGHVQVSQAPNRDELDKSGEIDYRYILNLLDELGYRDYIGLEYCPSGTTNDSLNFLKTWGYMPDLKTSSYY